MGNPIADIDDLVARLAAHDYVCDRRLATVLFLAFSMVREFRAAAQSADADRIAK